MGRLVRRVLSQCFTHLRRPSISGLRCRSPPAIYPGTRRAALAFPVDLAPDEVYPADPITRAAGGLLHHRFTLTPGPLINQRASGGLLSVALSRGLLRVGVTHRPALWSPDVPRRLPQPCGCCSRRDRLADPFADSLLGVDFGQIVRMRRLRSPPEHSNYPTKIFSRRSRLGGPWRGSRRHPPACCVRAGSTRTAQGFR